MCMPTKDMCTECVSHWLGFNITPASPPAVCFTLTSTTPGTICMHLSQTTAVSVKEDAAVASGVRRNWWVRNSIPGSEPEFLSPPVTRPVDHSPLHCAFSGGGGQTRSKSCNQRVGLCIRVGNFPESGSGWHRPAAAVDIHEPDHEFDKNLVPARRWLARRNHRRGLY